MTRKQGRNGIARLPLSVNPASTARIPRGPGSLAFFRASCLEADTEFTSECGRGQESCSAGCYLPCSCQIARGRTGRQ